MEDGRFDAMARVLGGPTSRRRGLAAMLGSLIGLAGAAAAAKGRAEHARRDRQLDAGKRSGGAGAQDAGSARTCTPDDKSCTKNIDCCSLKCVKLREKKVCINSRSDR